MAAINVSPTPYPALNAVLVHFVQHVRALLGANFIGAYLQGSFALGGHDEGSDADFLVAVEHDIHDDEVPALDALHGAIHDFPKPWGHRLEGSYVPAGILRRLSMSPRDPPGAQRPPTWIDPGTGGTGPQVYPFWFLDHGARTLVRSEHDNTQVVRWMTREKGIVLAGPDPRSLIEEVTADALRDEARETVRRATAKWLTEPVWSRWLQGYMVVFYCRVLHTLQTGEVNSKQTAAAWAQSAFDPRWHKLIALSLEVEAAAFQAEAADHDVVAETQDFMRYALRWAESTGR
jgi:Domain of unknown function (DUF4111)